MALKKRLQDKDIAQELILDSDSDDHTSEDKTSPLSISVLLLLEIMQQLVEQTNSYYHQYLDIFHKGRSPLPDLTVQEMYLFLPINVQLGHGQTDRLKDY
jgi:hypothetical protein